MKLSKKEIDDISIITGTEQSKIREVKKEFVSILPFMKELCEKSKSDTILFASLVSAMATLIEPFSKKTRVFMISALIDLSINDEFKEKEELFKRYKNERI